MSKCHRALLWLVGLFLVAVVPVLRAQHPVVLFSSTNDLVNAGSTVFVSVTALNTGSAPLPWRALREMDGEIIRNGQRVSVVLELEPLGNTAQRVVIAPGSFTNQTYSFVVPLYLTGQVILEFPGFHPHKLVFQVEPPLPEAPKPESWLARWLRDAEPEGSPKAYDPLRFFRDHISGYEPFYFIAGPDSPNAKFQVSFKYRLLNRQGDLARDFPNLSRLHLAYTQTSLWDLNAPSAPFFDSSYKPEVLYTWEEILGGGRNDSFRFDFQMGLQHESNGRDGLESRSLNIAYVRPTFVFGNEKSLQLTLQPRAWVYVADLDDNPDLADYRGYGDLRAIIGWKRGLQLSATGRIGDTWENGALQLDLTYPMMRVFYSNFSLYLHAQYFTGYGESLLRYNEKSSAFRIGVSMYR